jgi:hypothetical protein
MGRKALAAVLVPVAILGGVSVACMALLRASDAGSVRDLEAALALPPAAERFDPASLDGLPEPARRYLTAAIAPGTPLSRSARLTMEGRMRLKGDWLPMRATQTISADGFVWDAEVDRRGVHVRAWDTLGPDGGRMRVWLMGVLPVVRAGGADVTRSAAGRVAAERVWLPTALLPGAGVTWEALDADTARARMELAGEAVALDLRVDADGRPTAVRLLRWGDPDRTGTYGPLPFGGDLEGARTFGGITIPTRIRAGWGYGTGTYAPFFDVTVTGADFSGADVSGGPSG